MAAKTLLEGPSPASCTSKLIDFTDAGLPEYAKSFAVAIDNLATPDECAALLAAAESTVDGKWEQAMVNIGGGRQRMVMDQRNCGRIIWDDVELASRIQDRIMPHLPKEIVNLTNNAVVTGSGPVKRSETWRLTRLNERLRFLKYTSGMYFRQHCDGSYVTPDGKEVSFLTVHLYLNGDPPTSSKEIESRKEGSITEKDRANRPLVGGATRFFSWSMIKHWDFAPTKGSCIVFQHRNLIHSGEDVEEGTKYTMRTDVMYEKVGA